MKLHNFYHCIQYEYRGKDYISGSFLHYPASLRTMISAFYLSVIDKGFKLPEVVNIQFSIDEVLILRASSAPYISGRLPDQQPRASIGSADASR
jgi:hypothetical protein